MLRSQFAVEKDVAVRRAIALALGKLADTEALDVLIAALRDPRSPEPVRDASLEAVETIGTDKAVTALSDLLSQKALSPDRQPRVIAALGRFKDPAAMKPLLDSLKNSVPAVRSAAVDALVAIVKARKEAPRGEVSRSVRGLLADPAVAVRHRAIAAAAELEDREAIPALLDRGREVRIASSRPALALAALPDLRALQVYLRGLTDKNTDLRQRLGHRDRQPARPGRPGARPARDAQRAAPGALARAPDDLRRAEADHRLAGRRPVPDRRDAERRRQRADRSQSQLRGARRASRDLAGRQAGRSQGAGRPRPDLQRRRRPRGLRLRRDRQPDRPAGPDGRRLRRHPDRLAQRQAGLRVLRPPRVRPRTGAVRRDAEEGDQSRADPLRQPRRAVAVRRRRHGAGRLRLPQGPVRRGFNPEVYRAFALKGRATPIAAASSSAT